MIAIYCIELIWSVRYYMREPSFADTDVWPAMRAHAKFLTCCRCARKVCLSCSRYRSASSPLSFASAVRWLRTFHSVGSRENFHIASPVRNLTEIGLEIPGDGRSGQFSSPHRAFSFLRRDVKNRTSNKNQATWKEQQRGAAILLREGETRSELRLSQTWSFESTLPVELWILFSVKGTASST